MLDNSLKHPVRIVQHLIIPEPQHAKPLIFKPLVAAVIGFVVRVLAAIHFDDQPLRQTDKIDDVAPDRNLPFELVSGKAMGAQQVPQPPFGVGHI
jgi:hypothetical protein